MTSWESLVSLAVLATVLLAILIRPGGFHEAVPAVIGAGILLILRLEAISHAGHVLREAADVLVFLAAMMVISALAELAGVFDWVALRIAARAGGYVFRLFLLIYGFGAVLTAFFSLDVTVIVLTPIVFAMCSRFALPPVPFLVICTFVANIPSLLFPMSNLTNLLLYAEFSISFTDFVAIMVVPNTVALICLIAITWLLFRTHLPERFAEPAQPATPSINSRWLRTAAIVLIMTLLGIIGLGVVGAPLSIAAALGAMVLLILGWHQQAIAIPEVSHRIAWPVLPFVVAMLVLVDAVNRNSLSHLDWSYPNGLLAGTAMATGAAVLGSNIVNNVPMTLLAVPFIHQSDPAASDRLAYATLIGANIGPTLTTYGSLATLLWLSIVRRRGVGISTGQYMRHAWIVTLPVLGAALASLWLALWLLG